MQNKSLLSSPLLLGQQCDNNFRTENVVVPCNHHLQRDDSHRRRDMMAYDEVLTQSSGHLSFATRYNSREKRNNNLNNENDDNNMPTQICTREIEKKEEDEFGISAVAASKHKAKCFNDIYSWRTVDERDNQKCPR